MSLWPWEDAIKAVIADRVTVLAEYDEFARSPTFEIRLPSVILLREYVDLNRPAAFSRWNLAVRDGFSCAYCGSVEELTFDHVIPKSRGGESAFENALLACARCNSRKGNRTPEEAGMVPRHPPYTPTVAQLRELGRHYPPPDLHRSWLDYAYWDMPLES
ncbi:MAG: HNH endonuclease [Stutzerimonas stutzeri]|nr:MAG: HNH endonuclease [Stutzerimonas stutzeri]